MNAFARKLGVELSKAAIRWDTRTSSRSTASRSIYVAPTWLLLLIKEFRESPESSDFGAEEKALAYMARIRDDEKLQKLVVIQHKLVRQRKK